MPEPRPIAPDLIGSGPTLVVGRCGACGRMHFPLGSACPYCAAAECTPGEVGPAGRLCLFTVVSNRPPGYRGPLPYGFGVVEMEGGLRVITRLTESRLDRLRPGLAMRLVVEPLFTDDDGRPVLAWAFAPEADA
jgi:uncharacterized OB-fold protein